jgi:hypothetical protein
LCLATHTLRGKISVFANLARALRVVPWWKAELGALVHGARLTLGVVCALGVVPFCAHGAMALVAV